MKQQGKTWYTPEGKETLAKYLPVHDRLFEKLGQKIAAEATEIERKLRDAKAMFIDLCKTALRNNPDKGAKTRFTFHTFDREFKIEFDIQTENVRVYRATRKNPSSKDYELVNMDFNKSYLSETPSLPANPFPRTNSATELQEAIKDPVVEALGQLTLGQARGEFMDQSPDDNLAIGRD